jgi:hypothetical protein
MAAMHKERNGGVRSGWQGVARSGFVRSARARHGAAGKTWPGLAPRDTERLAWRDVDRRRLARIRRHGATWITRRDTERLARSGVGSHREARIRRQGDAGTGIARFGSAGMAAHGRATSVPARQAWICIAAIGWDCPGAAGMARWACNVAAGMDRHDQVGVKPHGRHGVARSGCASAASQAWHGLALQGLALRGWLGSSWKRFARLASAGMAADATTW